jgi:formate dehydrogenase maturation protein FdhE
VTDYLSHATTATGVPITECEVCGQRHPVTRAHCSRCRSWSAFQRSGLCLICSEIVGVRTNACPSTLGPQLKRPPLVRQHQEFGGLTPTKEGL